MKKTYARISNEHIKNAFDEFIDALGRAGMKFRCDKTRNLKVITSMGTVKDTYCVPESMWHCVDAYEQKAPSLIVDFMGLKEFSARQISSVLRDAWPSLRTLRVLFPGTEGRNEVHAAHLARSLELAGVREALAEAIRPEIGDARYVGFPAVLGIKRTPAILEHLRKLLGVPVFEIPMMPASVPGFRLKEVFDAALPQMGLLRLIDKRVESVSRTENGNFLLAIGGNDETVLIQARAVVLATGRFMGKGLISSREGIREPVFNLPLSRPAGRLAWHRHEFLSPEGHPINSAGVEVDDRFRPVDGAGQVVYGNLFAAGTILAHQDWMRMKCGSGLAIATAYAAVNACLGIIKKSDGENA